MILTSVPETIQVFFSYLSVTGFLVGGEMLEVYQSLPVLYLAKAVCCWNAVAL